MVFSNIDKLRECILYDLDRVLIIRQYKKREEKANLQTDTPVDDKTDLQKNRFCFYTVFGVTFIVTYNMDVKTSRFYEFYQAL